MRHRLIVCFLCCAGVSAADLVSRELVVTLEAEPTEFSWQIDSDGGSYSGNDMFATHLGMVLGGRYSLSSPGSSVGLMVGAGIAAGAATFEPSGDLWWGEGRLSAGMGWALTHRLTVVAEAGIAAGLDRMTSPGTSAYEGFTASGAHLAVLPAAAIYWDLGSSSRLSFTAGWRFSRHQLNDQDIDITLDQSGPTFSLGYAWALSDLPPSLE